jgi:3-oxoacyl-[acyl-carrier-protein] synthase II
MKAFINGMGNISPQKSWGVDSFLADPVGYEGNRLTCVEPDYTQWIDPKQLRRMSRIIKMGITASMMAMKQAGVEKPDGIIVGTGYGCLEDTGIFLSKMIENKEEALNPTPFIQSTHNTIGGQIALLLQCQAYNQTYAHRSFSFENSLLDALLHLTETPALHLLVGGVDEITGISHTIQSRMGLFKRKAVSSLDLFTTHSRGTLNGEGSTFFVLSGIQDEQSVASVEAVTTFFKPTTEELIKGLSDFLHQANLTAAEIDFVLLGKSGDQDADGVIGQIASLLFSTNATGVFKHLSGEYPTASAFALWLAAKMMAENRIPPIVSVNPMIRPIKTILVFNSYFGHHYSLMLLRTCRDTR